MRRVEGFSLIELIMVIAILGILAAFVGPVLFNAMRSYDQAQKSVQTQAKMRYAMERMSREVREVRRQATDATLLDITLMTATSLGFFKTDSTPVMIAATGNQVNLAYSTVSAMLTDQLGSFSLQYFEPDGATVATTASSLAFVQISMTLSEGTNLFSARSRVELKNAQ
jgi:prepilin-type N-terminal cleavage/methylation domain-containing protein